MLREKNITTEGHKKAKKCQVVIHRRLNFSPHSKNAERHQPECVAMAAVGGFKVAVSAGVMAGVEASFGRGH